MSNFAKKIEDALDEELYSWINELDFRVVSLASDELARRSLNKLQKTIKTFNDQSSKQTEKMINLTQGIVLLTIALVIGLLFQIYLAKIQVSPILSEQQRNERQAFEFCKTTANTESTSWPSATGGEIKCSEILKMFDGKFK